MTVSILPLADPNTLHCALAALKRGYPVVFPTDTVYGIGTPAYDVEAVGRLYAIKRRPLHLALPLLLADIADLPAVARAVPPVAAELAQHYWPGALTLVVPAAASIPPGVIAHGTTVAVRVPDHDWVRMLIRQLGQPLATTSANRHGASNTTTTDTVAAELGNDVALIVNGGATPGDVASTVVDCTGAHPRILREGGITLPL